MARATWATSIRLSPAWSSLSEYRFLMNPDVTESPESLAETVVGHLLDLIAGRFTVTPTGVEQCAESSPRRQILGAFMELHQELRAREEAYDEAIGELQRTLESLQDRHQQLMHNQALT